MKVWNDKHDTKEPPAFFAYGRHDDSNYCSALMSGYKFCCVIVAALSFGFVQSLRVRLPRALKPRQKTTDAVFAAPSGVEPCPILFVICKNPSRSRRWDPQGFLPPILPCANPNWLTPIPRHADSVHWNLQFATRERCTLVPDHFRHYHMLAGETPEKKHDVYLCFVIPVRAN